MEDENRRYRIVEKSKKNGQVYFMVEKLLDSGWLFSGEWVNIVDDRSMDRNYWDTMKCAKKALERYLGKKIESTKYHYL